MESSERQVMTVDDLAAYLRIPRSSVYKLAQRGQVPCQKVGRHWRFSRRAVERWLDGRRGSGDDQEGARGD